MSEVAVVGSGYVGESIVKGLTEKNIPHVVLGRGDVEYLEKCFKTHKPSVLINAAGWPGSVNVDSCEDEVVESYEGNVMLPLRLGLACRNHGVRMIHVGSGCIYKSKGYPIEEDLKPDLLDSVYRRTKVTGEQELLGMFPEAIQLRIRMPFGSFSHRRNLIEKIRAYPKLIQHPNSMTCVDELGDLISFLIDSNPPGGIYHATHEEPITLPEIATMDGREDFTLVESLDTEVERSNVILSVKKLSLIGFQFRPIREAMEECIFNLNENDQ